MTESREPIRDKRGGICFRVDDNQPIRKWTDYAAIFDRHGYRFCAALCFGRMAGDRAYIDLVRDLEARGHEILDHTPLHSVDKIPFPPGDDPEAWRRRPGVDHVDDRVIYLTYEKIDASSIPQGRADISGRTMTGRTPGDLADPNRNRFVAVYLPELDAAYRFETSGDPENPVLQLQSFWGEDNVDLGECRDVAYHKLSKTNVFMTLEARRRLVESMRALADRLGFRLPVTWIQPGSGGCSDLYREAARDPFGDRYGYVSAATYPNRAFKCYNEADPNRDKAFGMQWGDFDEESKDLEWNMKRIADGVARRHVLFGHSHFTERIMPDGWDGYLRRIDRLLAWCRETGIPVRTQAEWARILYGTEQDPTVNVFPALDIDRDGDGIPDGCELASATLDRERGPAEAGGVSLAMAEAGTIVQVKRLGGLEKGPNEFAIWTCGNPGDSVEVTFDFAEVGRVERLSFPAETPAWARQRGTVSVPEAASRADLTISRPGSGREVLRIGGMSLSRLA